MAVCSSGLGPRPLDADSDEKAERDRPGLACPRSRISLCRTAEKRWRGKDSPLVRVTLERTSDVPSLLMCHHFTTSSWLEWVKTNFWPTLVVKTKVGCMFAHFLFYFVTTYFSCVRAAGCCLSRIEYSLQQDRFLLQTFTQSSLLTVPESQLLSSHLKLHCHTRKQHKLLSL